MLPTAKEFFGSFRTIRFGIFLAQHLSRKGGCAIARTAANAIARAKPAMYWNVRANLTQVLGPDTGDDALDQAVWSAFFNAGCVYYDHFHALGRTGDDLYKALALPSQFWRYVEAAHQGNRGIVLISGHISAFDLAGISLTSRGVEVQALSVSNPSRGFQFLNDLRAEGGIDITPITPQSIRKGLLRLKAGGIVFTGVEYPIGPGREPLNFFGRTALLPTGHVRLARMSHAMVVALAVLPMGGGRYRMAVQEVPMDRTHDKQRDEINNAERVLKTLEGWIRAYPEHWSMFLPVWPELVQNP